MGARFRHFPKHTRWLPLMSDTLHCSDWSIQLRPEEFCSGHIDNAQRKSKKSLRSSGLLRISVCSICLSGRQSVQSLTESWNHENFTRHNSYNYKSNVVAKLFRFNCQSATITRTSSSFSPLMFCYLPQQQVSFGRPARIYGRRVPISSLFIILLTLRV